MMQRTSKSILTLEETAAFIDNLIRSKNIHLPANHKISLLRAFLIKRADKQVILNGSKIKCQFIEAAKDNTAPTVTVKFTRTIVRYRSKKSGIDKFAIVNDHSYEDKILGQGVNGFVYAVDKTLSIAASGINIYQKISSQRIGKIAVGEYVKSLINESRLMNLYLNDCFHAKEIVHGNKNNHHVAVLISRRFPGVNLKKLLSNSQLIWTPASMLDLLRKSWSSIQYLHANGVLHHDIKDDNLIVDTEVHDGVVTIKNVQIIDLGCAGLMTEGLLFSRGNKGCRSPEMWEIDNLINSSSATPISAVLPEKQSVCLTSKSDTFSAGRMAKQTLTYPGFLNDVFATHCSSKTPDLNVFNLDLNDQVPSTVVSSNKIADITNEKMVVAQLSIEIKQQKMKNGAMVAYHTLFGSRSRCQFPEKVSRALYSLLQRIVHPTVDTRLNFDLAIPMLDQIIALLNTAQVEPVLPVSQVAASPNNHQL